MVVDVVRGGIVDVAGPVPVGVVAGGGRLGAPLGVNNLPSPTRAAAATTRPTAVRSSRRDGRVDSG
jgi:hypothetical protein